MALNTTFFIGSGYADNDNVANQTAVVVPEYISYALLCVMSTSIPMVIIPAFWAIVIIVKNKKLQTNNNIFLINLLLSDVGLVVALWCTDGRLTVLYLLGVNVDVDCTIETTPIMISLIANKLMFIPTCVDRFIHIAFPFSYKRIVTTKAIIATIITLWITAIMTGSLTYINKQFDYIPSVGTCKPGQTNIPISLIILLSLFIPIMLIIITSIYLHQRIIKSKKFFHSVKRTAAQQRESTKAGRLAEILQEQVQPTLAVFRVGGIDAVFDILAALIVVAAHLLSLSSTTAFIVSAVFPAHCITYLQSVNHWLVYNVDIREKMFDCIRMRNKRSKVIVLHRE